MREVISHKKSKHDLKIEALDDLFSDIEHHCYLVSGFNTKSNPSDTLTAYYGKPATQAHILFQQGPIDELGANGLTDVALMAILVDRLESQQRTLLELGGVSKTLDLARQTLASMLRDQS